MSSIIYSPDSNDSLSPRMTSIEPQARTVGYYLRSPKSPAQELISANINLHNLFSGLDCMPQRYLALYKSTQQFISTVYQLSRLPGSFQHAAMFLVGFGSDVLRAPRSCFSRMLNSQRGSIYYLLDDALLHILVEEWEKEECGSGEGESQDWNEQINVLSRELAKGMEGIPSWAEEDYTERVSSKGLDFDFYFRGDLNVLLSCYFARSREFLKESLAVHQVRRKVNEVARGRLPTELVNEVVRYISMEEGIPTERLRTRYFAKGKGKLM